MTEAGWLAAEFFPPMLDHIRGRATTRQFLLLGVALCRRIWEHIAFDDCRATVEAVERLAEHPRVDDDDPAVSAEVDALFQGLQLGGHRLSGVDDQTYGAYLAAAVCGSMWHDPANDTEGVSSSVAITIAGVDRGPAWEAERRAHAELLLELFGNPFRPVAFAPSWRSETVLALATGIYAERAFDRLPILADALEEAGCDHADVLSHCRGPGPHARGCWVVDAVLGKG